MYRVVVALGVGMNDWRMETAGGKPYERQHRRQMMSERESEDSIHIIPFFILEIGILSLELLTCLKLRAESW
jgi:hypothetical protein